ncbi:MAG: hypothetical protein AAF748_12555 [Pseudomonadota bacterium]
MSKCISERTTHRVDASPGCHHLSGFMPGRDHVEIDLSSTQADILYTGHEATEHPGFTLRIDDETTIDVCFPGLADIPVDAVSLLIRDRDTGGPVCLHLADLIAAMAEDGGAPSGSAAAWDRDLEEEARAGAALYAVEEVTGFIAGEDVLRLSVPGMGPSPQIDVSPSPDGGDSWVRVDGALVAVLKGEPSATIWDIYLEAEANTAA